MRRAAVNQQTALLESIEQVCPNLMESIMRDCGIRISEERPENRIPMILSASFDRHNFSAPVVHMAARSYGISPRDRLFSVTLKRLTRVLRAVRHVGRVHVPLYLDVVTGRVLAGRFSVARNSYRAVDREQPVKYVGIEDEEYEILVNLGLIGRKPDGAAL